MLAGDQGAALIAAIEQAQQELVYKAGGPRGRFKEADDARQAAQMAVAELVARRAELERDLDALEDRRERAGAPASRRARELREGRAGRADGAAGAPHAA